MPQDAIAKILAAEEQASVLCRVSSERAAEMCAELTHRADEELEAMRAETLAQYEQTLARMRAGAERLLAKRSVEASAEAEALKARAGENMNKAVELIVWGMVEKCR